MTGSEQQSKTSQTAENQLPLKGFTNTFKHPKHRREMTIEGMGSGRYRITAKKTVKNGN